MLELWLIFFFLGLYIRLKPTSENLILLSFNVLQTTIYAMMLNIRSSVSLDNL